jgi:hypothetical protein
MLLLTLVKLNALHLSVHVLIFDYRHAPCCHVRAVLQVFEVLVMVLLVHAVEAYLLNPQVRWRQYTLWSCRVCAAWTVRLVR